MLGYGQDQEWRPVVVDPCEMGDERVVMGVGMPALVGVLLLSARPFFPDSSSVIGAHKFR